MKILLFLIFLVTASTVKALTIPKDNEDKAYWNFIKAKNEPSLLATGKDGRLANSPHRPLPTYKEININHKQAILGHDLFQDKSLSLDGTIACSSCHNGRSGGGDGRPVAIGINGQKGDINVPTVFNSGFNFRQFWDGRAFDLEEQAQQPVENPIEMGHHWPDLIEKLRQTNYQARFNTLYPDGLTQENIGHAIAQMERGLIVNNAPYDLYLSGDSSALSNSALRGLERFQSYGCIACHNGINLGGNLYHKFELTLYHPKDREITEGIYSRSGRKKDKGMIKVPTLHNIMRSSPYFHTGSINTLDTAIKMQIAQHTKRSVNADDIKDIKAFLKSLTGKMPPTIREIF